MIIDSLEDDLCLRRGAKTQYKLALYTSIAVGITLSIKGVVKLVFDYFA